MKFQSLSVAAVVTFGATSAMAAAYQCGIYVGDAQTPAVEFAYDTADESAFGQTDDFVGGVQKQDDGSLVVFTATQADIAAAALFAIGSQSIMAMLVVSQDSNATTWCELGNRLVGRPTLKFKK